MILLDDCSVPKCDGQTFVNPDTVVSDLFFDIDDDGSSVHTPNNRAAGVVIAVAASDTTCGGSIQIIPRRHGSGGKDNGR